MKYRDKVKQKKEPKQKSNTNFWDLRYTHTKICPSCGRTFPEYSHNTLCCGTSIQKILK